MYDLGENTRDLRALGVPHPTEHGLPDSDRENHIRRRANIGIWAAAALLTTSAITTLTLMTYGHRAGWDDPVTRQFIGLILMLAMNIATAYLAAGLVERQNRQQRTLIRRAMARADANADVGDGNRAAIETNNRLVAEVVATLSSLEKRLHGLEAAVSELPDYGKAIKDGYALGRHSAGLSDLDQLPDLDTTGKSHNQRFDR